MSFSTIQESSYGLQYYRSSLLSGCPHAFTTRKGGVSPAPWNSLNFRIDQGDGPKAIEENYRRLSQELGIDPASIVTSHQVHKTDIHIATRADAGKGVTRLRDYEADALMTSEPGLPIVVFSADCGILLLTDRKHTCAAAIHAGWRGCAAGIVEKTVQAMKETYGVDPSDLFAAIGPSIGPCCFETDEDVVLGMREGLGSAADAHIPRKGPKYHVDLAGCNQEWLLRSGIPAEQIDRLDLCTCCHPDLLWSYRRTGNARGAQIAIISLPKEEC